MRSLVRAGTINAVDNGHRYRQDCKLPSACSTDVVPAPKNLRFSEVTQTSFRATWEHGAPDVALYRIGWTKKGETNFQYVREKQLSDTFSSYSQAFLDESHRNGSGPDLNKDLQRP